MGGYKPLKITANEAGLVQNREEFLLPDDAYPTLENAFLFRERIKRKNGYTLLGRLRRKLTAQALGNTVGAQTTYTFANILTTIGIVGEPNAEIEPGSLVITIGAPDTATFTDTGLGTFVVTGVGVSAGSSINYATGAVTIVISASGGGSAITADINYFPGLPVMGLRSRELNNINNEMLIAFDQKYAYRFSNGWQEFIPGTTWTGNNSDFFWSTNYWVGDGISGNLKIFWVTNFSGPTGDPIRYTNGVAWADFAPQIDAAGNLLTQCLVLLPFRGRLVAFNTLEGANLGTSIAYTNRIRWAEIGNPFTVVSPIRAGVVPDAWRDDIRGKGGYLDIPTSEAITAVGFVRDNVVIYTERATWQLRYTGRSIAPFQIERVNSELGSESTFSAVQFDTSLVGIGDKGVVECDSFKSNRIDIKIPDLIFEFNNQNDGTKRVHGIRDFQQRIAYWTYPYFPGSGASDIFPNRRLVYNYENDSWAIFKDSFTALGTYQAQTGVTWASQNRIAWQSANFPWINKPALFPSIVGGNQQGFVEILTSNLDSTATNGNSLSITAILGRTDLPTRLTVVNHNLDPGTIIRISNIPTGTPFATSLNLQKFSVSVIDADTLDLFKYNSTEEKFSDPQTDAPATYVGGGLIAIRDNFRVVSKKFNFLDEGQNIQLGYIDILTESTDNGAFSLNVYLNYNDNDPINTLPQNVQEDTDEPDPFFNTTIPTVIPTLGNISASKYWQRVFCPVRGNFITLEYTLSNAQMNGVEQENDVQIDAQVLWVRQAGRMTNI